MWTWNEHLFRSDLVHEEPQHSIELLIDEMEAHLHPFWQRMTVPAIMSVVQELFPGITVQVIIATHSPLVLASIEPIFDEEQDNLFHLYLNPEDGSVQLNNVPFVIKPKEKSPQDAYRWDNYRFVCSALNGRKGTSEDVLDPFTLQDGWFAMHFPSLQLKPGQSLAADEASSVLKTIARLKLNDYTCVRGRKDRLVPYLLGKYPFDFLEEIAPFLACELRRQKIEDRNHPIWIDFQKRGQTS